MAAATASSPSQFAVLLRRSRFASYDPAIAQVYTSHDGDAHRGNYGFKRPFPLRRRQGFVTVQSVDSKTQQTEFNRAESRARFVQRWNEVGSNVDTKESNWAQKCSSSTQLVDSEFAPLDQSQALEAQDSAERSKALARSGLPPQAQGAAGPVKLTSSMSPRQFERYLAQLRTLRPAFLEHLKTAGPDAKLDPKNLHWLSKHPSSPHDDFLSKHTGQWLQTDQSRNFAQTPHRNGGLTYSHRPHLQNLFTSKPQPGLVLQSGVSTDFPNRGARETKTGANVVSFAGLTTLLRNPLDKKVLLELHRKPNKRMANEDTGEPKQIGVDPAAVNDSVALFRMGSSPKLLQVPNVVGRVHQGAKAARIEAEVYIDEATDFGSTNPHVPGSRLYVAPEVDIDSQKPWLQVSLSTPPVRRWKWGSTNRDGGQAGSPQLVASLGNMLSRE